MICPWGAPAPGRHPREPADRLRPDRRQSQRTTVSRLSCRGSRGWSAGFPAIILTTS